MREEGDVEVRGVNAKARRRQDAEALQGATGREDGEGVFKETEIGMIPAHWEAMRLEEIIEKPQYGYTQSASEEPIGPKFLRITDITENGVNWTTVPYCECEQDDLEKYRLTKGDILFARTGATTGKSFLIDSEPSNGVFASYLIRVKVKKAVIPAYLYAFFNTEAYWW